jgi:hypothetical protein
VHPTARPTLRCEPPRRQPTRWRDHLPRWPSLARQRWPRLRGLDLGPTGLDLGLDFFYFKKYIYGIGRQQPTQQMNHFCILQIVSIGLTDTCNSLSTDTKNGFYTSVRGGRWYGGKDPQGDGRVPGECGPYHMMQQRWPRRVVRKRLLCWSF